MKRLRKGRGHRMWKDKEVVQELLKRLLQAVMNEGLPRESFQMTCSKELSAAADLVRKCLKEVSVPIRASLEGRIGAKQAEREAMNSLFRNACVVAQEIEKKRNWHLIGDFYQIARVILERYQDYGICAMIYAKVIHGLVGSEGKYLIGIRGDEAVWETGGFLPNEPLELQVHGTKDGGFLPNGLMDLRVHGEPLSKFMMVSPPGGLPDNPFLPKGGIPLGNAPAKPVVLLPSERKAVDNLFNSGLDESMRYIGRSLADLVPCIHEWADLSDPRLKSYTESWDARWKDIIDLLMDAYEHPNYVIDRFGVKVKITGCPGVQGIVLRTRGGLNDPNYVDIVAKIILEDGKCLLYVLDSTRECKGDSPSNKIARYFLWLIASVYHGLIVRKDAEIRLKAETTHPNQEVVRRRNIEPKSTRFHKRMGHKRRGKMSERHRLEIQELEHEFQDVQILSKLPPGYNYVFPCLVGAKERREELKRMPIMARARFKDGIIQSLKTGGAVDLDKGQKGDIVESLGLDRI